MADETRPVMWIEVEVPPTWDDGQTKAVEAVAKAINAVRAEQAYEEEREGLHHYSSPIKRTRYHFALSVKVSVRGDTGGQEQ